jgi:hypothetical protein
MQLSQPLKTRIYEALGKASMCWNPRPSTAVFDSTECKKVGDELVAAIEAELTRVYWDGNRDSQSRMTTPEMGG